MKIMVTQSQNVMLSPQFTQDELVLAVLQHRGATTPDIFANLGIKSPSAVIHRLRKSGYQIDTKLTWKNTTKYTRLQPQTEYSLRCSGPRTAIKNPLRVSYAMGGMK